MLIGAVFVSSPPTISWKGKRSLRVSSLSGTSQTSFRMKYPCEPHRVSAEMDRRRPQGTLGCPGTLPRPLSGARPPDASRDGPGRDNVYLRTRCLQSDGWQGWADVWYRGHFALEYKGPHKDLVKACDQLLRYKDDLENPPLLIVSDHGESEIRDHLGSADAPAGRHLRPKRGRSRVRPSGDVADVSTVQQPERSSSMMADDGRCHDSARSVSTKTVNRNSLRKTRFCVTRSIL